MIINNRDEKLPASATKVESCVCNKFAIVAEETNDYSGELYCLSPPFPFSTSFLRKSALVEDMRKKGGVELEDLLL